MKGIHFRILSWEPTSGVKNWRSEASKDMVIVNKEIGYGVVEVRHFKGRIFIWLEGKKHWNRKDTITKQIVIIHNKRDVKVRWLVARRTAQTAHSYSVQVNTESYKQCE